MKCLIVLSVVAFVAGVNSAVLSDEKIAKLHEIRDKCVIDTGATPEVYDKFIAGDFTNQDKTTKCFVKCFYEKAGFFDKDDNLDVKVTIAKVAADYGEENAEKWVTPCKDIENKDPCEKAFEIAQCFYKNKNQVAVKA